MAENAFRILLDFRELNFKFYKFVWMSISPRDLVTIKDLKDAVLKKFAIERTDLLLFLRDGLLPEDENISNILRENDNIRLFYAEPSNVNLNVSRTINNEEVEESCNNDQVKSPKKRKEHSDISEDNSEQIECNKKRKHSFSNGTYLFKNDSTPEISSLMSAPYDDMEIVTTADLYSFENGKGRKSSKIKKKLKYSHDASQITENEIPSSGINLVSEKNQSRVNSCKKKKKHKHSKDVSENEIFHDSIIRMSEINENELEFHEKKKKKHKHSLEASKMGSVSESAVSLYRETIDEDKKLKYLDTSNDQSQLRESLFQTVNDDSQVLKLGPVSFCASSVGTSSGIGQSLKTSLESNEKISSEQNCSKSYVSEAASPEAEENNMSVSQGNSCKKKKRRRHRKRKSQLLSQQFDLSNDCLLDVSPQKTENADSLSMPTSNHPAENSPKDQETLTGNSESNAFHSSRNAISIQAKPSIMQPFGRCLPNTSTPFAHTFAVPKKNIIFKLSNSSTATEDQSCSATTSRNMMSPTIQKNTLQNENSLSTHSSPFSVDDNKNTIAKKSLSAEIKNLDVSTDSFSNFGTKSRLLSIPFSYKSFPPLNSCPLVGTRIAYKVLELDESYSPVVSNYKEGIVRAINSQTDELEIELTKPEVKEARFGKFENIYDDDEYPPCEVIEKVKLSWPSLIDPVRVVC